MSNPDNDFFLRSPSPTSASPSRARLFIATVPSRKYLSTISSASSRSEGSCSASRPEPLHRRAPHHIALVLGQQRHRPSRPQPLHRVFATRGTTSPRCHRVRDSSTGNVSSNPASSSAYRSSSRRIPLVIRRATSAARFLTSTSSPKSSRTSARTPLYLQQISQRSHAHDPNPMLHSAAVSPKTPCGEV